MVNDILKQNTFNDVIALIDKILSSNTVEDAHGNALELSGNIDDVEGEYIFNIITGNNKIINTLEVGCGYGISSLYICAALWNREKATHTIIDPLQNKEYSGIGIFNLERINCKFYKFFESPSEYVLPQLAQKQPNSFDLILIDGWHTFDHVLTDIFYSNRLLKTGGLLILDDCRFPSIAKAAKYLSKFPSYKIHSETDGHNLSRKAQLSRFVGKLIPEFISENLLSSGLSELIERLRNPSMLSFIKTNEDKRNAIWYSKF